MVPLVSCVRRLTGKKSRASIDRTQNSIGPTALLPDFMMRNAIERDRDPCCGPMDLAWLAAGQVTASVRRLMGAHRNDHRGNELSARCRRSFSSGCSCPPPTTRQKHLERDRLHGRSVPNCFQACGGGGGRDVCLAHGRTSLPLTLVDANRASDWPLSTREKKTGVGIDSRCQAIDPRQQFSSVSLCGQ